MADLFGFYMAELSGFSGLYNNIQNEGFLDQQAYPSEDRVPEGDVALSGLPTAYAVGR